MSLPGSLSTCSKEYKWALLHVLNTLIAICMHTMEPKPPKLKLMLNLTCSLGYMCRAANPLFPFLLNYR